MDRRRGSDNASGSSGSSQSRGFARTEQEEQSLRLLSLTSSVNFSRSEKAEFYSNGSSGEWVESRGTGRLDHTRDNSSLHCGSVFTDTSVDRLFHAERQSPYRDPHANKGTSSRQASSSVTSNLSNESLQEWRAHDDQGCLHQGSYSDEYTAQMAQQQRQSDGEPDEGVASSHLEGPETLTPLITEQSSFNPQEGAVVVEVRGQADEHADRASTRLPEAATEANSAKMERMKYEVPEDPRNLVIDVILKSPSPSVSLQEIHNALRWAERFEATNGSVLDYLQGYQSIFAVSPVYDRVTLRRPLQTARGRRAVRDHRGPRDISSGIGSISYSYIATAFDLDALAVIYKRRGYATELMYGVLHVSSHRTFDIFLFPNGVVVWWGLSRRDHWLVEDDFLTSANSFVRVAVKERHAQKIIDELFPFWCSYELDKHYDASTPVRREEALARFGTNLCFDHYLIPDVKPIRTQIMLTVSYSLGHVAVVDFFDNVTQNLHKQVLGIPADIKGLCDYLSMRRKIAHLEGEILLASMSISALRDTPEFLWEMPWLYDYHELIERQNPSGQLVLWFIAKSEALVQQMAHIKSRRFTLFILGSDIFLILLLMADIFCLMAVLILKLYFSLEE
ncbi:hypothetical protein TraAM80_01986 [Trypanosoma rangeli]|uniref:DUF155 domain-containing protein n=1 Tax=Trypanosoma rangeli TaxID=5698 RepID=A0A422NW98_TRYRA|nr:uncharacterized protein TraAM80_01986 [Trypanosoma rangeli]RNF09718.1 hypothetical protein TraAM80_01986 [Trypanosoma rangeli]|eukprot:RNF09718.1 hypothetical protein TraAM80_01986 [Trypanosoma rangeli]